MYFLKIYFNLISVLFLHFVSELVEEALPEKTLGNYCFLFVSFCVLFMFMNAYFLFILQRPWAINQAKLQEAVRKDTAFSY